jgi:Mu transposase, C-terminal
MAFRLRHDDSEKVEQIRSAVALNIAGRLPADRACAELGLKRSQFYAYRQKYLMEGEGAIGRKQRVDTGRCIQVGRALLIETFGQVLDGYLAGRYDFDQALTATKLTPPEFTELLAEYRRKGGEALEAGATRHRNLAQALGEELRMSWCTFATHATRLALPVTTLRVLYTKTHPTACRVLPSAATLGGWLKSVDPSTGMTYEEQRDRYKVRHRVHAKYANHVWQFDQHTFNAMAEIDLVDPQTGEIKAVRPLLFVVLDVKSKLVMWAEYVLNYTTEMIVERALWGAIYPDPEHELLASGVPEHLYCDNGEQHLSPYFKRVCERLGIKVHYSEPHQPKPHGAVEGNHAWFQQDFEARQPGYRPGNPLDKQLPERIAAEANQDVLYLTLAELNRRLRRYLAEIQHKPARLAGFDGEISRWNAWWSTVPEARRAVPRPEEMAWEFMDERVCAVDGKGWVTLFGVAYTDHLLAAYKGSRVRVRFLRSDMRCVYVVDSSNALVCVARPDVDVVFADEFGLRQIAAENAASLRDRKQFREDAERIRRGVANGQFAPDEALMAAEGLDNAAQKLNPRWQRRRREEVREEIAQAPNVVAFPVPKPASREVDKATPASAVSLVADDYAAVAELPRFRSASGSATVGDDADLFS